LEAEVESAKQPSNTVMKNQQLKGQNIGGALAIAKELVGQVEGMVWTFLSTLYSKNCPFMP